jgi:DNA-binding transcriptional regulator YiaG
LCKTLGEHLRKKRVELALSMRQLAKTLGLGINPASVRVWEMDVHRPNKRYRTRIIEFLGFDPELTSPTEDR